MSTDTCAGDVIQGPDAAGWQPDTSMFMNAGFPCAMQKRVTEGRRGAAFQGGTGVEKPRPRSLAVRSLCATHRADGPAGACMRGSRSRTASASAGILGIAGRGGGYLRHSLLLRRLDQLRGGDRLGVCRAIHSWPLQHRHIHTASGGGVFLHGQLPPAENKTVEPRRQRTRRLPGAPNVFPGCRFSARNARTASSPRQACPRQA